VQLVHRPGTYGASLMNLNQTSKGKRMRFSLHLTTLTETKKHPTSTKRLTAFGLLGLTSVLRFDVALGWTNLNYNLTAGTDSGSFIGSRWSASTGLTADYKLNPFVLEPSAGVFVAWEHDRAFTDSLGNAIGSDNFSGGRASFGAKVARPIATS
jgi:hypothetical protein